MGGYLKSAMDGRKFRKHTTEEKKSIRRKRKQLKKQEKRLNVISLKEKVNLAVVENKLLKVKVLSLEKDKELNNCIVHNLNVSDVSVGEIIG